MRQFKQAALNEGIAPRIVESVLFKDELRRFEETTLRWQSGLFPDTGFNKLDLTGGPDGRSVLGTGNVAEAFYTGEYNEYPYVSPLLLVNEEAKETCKRIWLDRTSYRSLETRLVNLSQDIFLFSATEMVDFVLGVNGRGVKVPGFILPQPWDGKTWLEDHMNVSQADASQMGHLFFGFYRHVNLINEFILMCKSEHCLEVLLNFTNHITDIVIQYWLKWFPELHTISVAIWENRWGPRRHYRSTPIAKRTRMHVLAKKPNWISELAKRNRKIKMDFYDFRTEEHYRYPGKLKSLKQLKSICTVEADSV